MGAKQIHRGVVDVLEPQEYGSGVPPTAHHYTTLSGLQGIVTSETIFASHVEYLNDTNEWRHGVRVFEQAVASFEQDQVVKDDPKAAALAIRFRNAIEVLTTVKVYVTCFSTKADALSLWRGYSPESVGCSIEFELDKIIEQLGDRWILGRCEYDPAIQEQTARRLVGRYYDHLRTHNSPELTADEIQWADYESSFFADCMILTPLMKHQGFEEEQEVRLILDLFGRSDRGVEVHLSQGVPIPHVNCSIKGAVKGVTVGPASNPELTVEGVRRLLASAGISATVSRTNLPFRRTIGGR